MLLAGDRPVTVTSGLLLPPFRRCSKLAGVFLAYGGAPLRHCLNSLTAEPPISAPICHQLPDHHRRWPPLDKAHRQPPLSEASFYGVTASPPAASFGSLHRSSPPWSRGLSSSLSEQASVSTRETLSLLSRRYSMADPSSDDLDQLRVSALDNFTKLDLASLSKERWCWIWERRRMRRW